MNRNTIRRVVAAFLMSTFTTVVVFADQSVGWRNDGTGQFPHANPPLTWSTDKNIIWKTELPGRSLSSPVVVGRQIFVTAEPADLLCLFDDGTTLWRRSHEYTDVFGTEKGGRIERDLELARSIRKKSDLLDRERHEIQKKTGKSDSVEVLQLKSEVDALRQQVRTLTVFPPKPGGDTANTCSTPVSDGRNIFTVFGTGIVSSHSLNGKQNWMVFVEAPGSDHSASPLLIDGKLIVHLRNLVALDAATGKVIWQASTGARHGSPVAGRMGNSPVIVTARGAVVRVADGRILAKDQFQLGHCSPIVHNGIVYAMQDGPIKAVKLAKSDADQTKLAVHWELAGTRTQRLASPVHHDGLLYSVTEQGVLEATDAQTGRRVYRKRLNFRGGRVDPSVCLAGKLLYVSNNRGMTVVVRPGRKYEELARNELAGSSSSLTFHKRRVYIRANRNLYCIGE